MKRTTQLHGCQLTFTRCLEIRGSVTVFFETAFVVIFGEILQKIWEILKNKRFC